MSVKYIHLVWTQALDVADNRLLVLLALADWCNDEGECWPKLPAIAAKTRVVLSTARACVRWLEQRGYITTLTGTGRGNPNRYKLHIPPIDPGKPPGNGGFSPEKPPGEPPKATGQQTKSHRVRPLKATDSYARATHDTSLTVIKEPSETRAVLLSLDQQVSDPPTTFNRMLSPPQQAILSRSLQPCSTRGCILMTNLPSGRCLDCERKQRAKLTPLYPRSTRQ